MEGQGTRGSCGNLHVRGGVSPRICRGAIRDLERSSSAKRLDDDGRVGISSIFVLRQVGVELLEHGAEGGSWPFLDVDSVDAV